MKCGVCISIKREEKSTPFGDHNGSPLGQQPRAARGLHQHVLSSSDGKTACHRGFSKCCIRYIVRKSYEHLGRTYNLTTSYILVCMSSHICIHNYTVCFSTCFTWVAVCCARKMAALLQLTCWRTAAWNEQGAQARHLKSSPPLIPSPDLLPLLWWEMRFWLLKSKTSTLIFCVASCVA